MIKILRVLRNLTNHPLVRDRKLNTIGKFFKWQIGTKLNPYPVVYPFIGSSKMIIKKGMGGATGHIYTGLFEFEDMAFVLHFLKPNDLFVDIGANVGSYTVLASGVKKAHTIAIEPIPITFDHLLNNIAINKIENIVTALNIGLGAKQDKLRFTASLDAVNHVVAEFETIEQSIEVKVDTLDSVLSEKQPLLLKIDVEGFETEVLKGAEKTLQSKELKAIIIELNGSGTRYGYDENAIHQKLLEYGYLPHTYDPFKRQLIKLKMYGKYNTIYLRDFEFITQRVQSGEAIKIFGKRI